MRRQCQMNTLTVMKYSFKCKIVFFHHEVRNHNKFDFYLYKSTIPSCIKYCCHNWVGFPSCYLKLLDKLQKWICRTVDPSLVASLEPLAHHRNVASLSLFNRYYFGRCLSGLAQLVPLPYSWGRTIPRSYNDVYVNSFFPCTAKLWNSLPIECFPLTYDLNGFNSNIINRYLLPVGYF